MDCPSWIRVTGDDCAGVERSRSVQGSDPFGPAVGGRRADEHVAVVVGNVAGDDQAEVGHVQRGGVEGVGVPGFDHDEWEAFEFELAGPSGSANTTVSAI